uniref:Uncharacterized protein n=1 Tax=Trypanosoma vivax (strain Y486) TaxID=1055687 RepID=G0TXK7_TRYVY|nr:conserved hypothetical protein [Trypanosoma vivax Y486]
MFTPKRTSLCARSRLAVTFWCKKCHISVCSLTKSDRCCWPIRRNVSPLGLQCFVSVNDGRRSHKTGNAKVEAAQATLKMAFQVLHFPTSSPISREQLHQCPSHQLARVVFFYLLLAHYIASLRLPRGAVST